MELLMGPWPWYVGGAIVALVMVALVFLGKSFGFSSNFRNICSMIGAGKSCSFFDFNWKSQQWNLLFLVGAVLGGFLSAHYLSNDQIPAISDTTVTQLRGMGFESAGTAYAPTEIFGDLSVKNIILLAIGGLLIGFGTRYAGGCTSGHAISGLSDLQWPSLVAVMGFFIGGLIMVHVLFPFIF
ncbi:MULTISPECIES: YeeE/YedE family protein [Sphingobacterium]|uniref:YeeE/YedE thiosulfate transporter family protein n=1 Tax=Sphingobacterium tenebrionis TaxID=3111775 RepID=A0ABU8I9M3_9SPHI|nr:MULTISPECIES: YeeE/YedE thiosulfate transporter family protein [unclassified Sphingobacterium]QBR12820.1 YeeE/YedE family protein [Sphingobacterium sp. CZ-2]